jgi:type III secretion protein R
MKKILPFLLLIFTVLAATPAFAQMPVAGGDQPVSKPILILFFLLILSLAPFILMMTTSFVKIAVVLSLIRTALGTQQIPPNQVVTGLALILTVYVMIPVGQQVYAKTNDVIHQADTNQDVLSTASLDVLKKAMDAGKEPVRDFLLKHVHDHERKLFYGLGRKSGMDKGEAEFSDKDFIVLIPAFVISELSEAFQIGFVIFLPFLVIDMVVSNILLSMGMFQLSPITVSLPFKLLLFVLVDGWYLITKGLVAGYMN